MIKRCLTCNNIIKKKLQTEDKFNRRKFCYGYDCSITWNYLINGLKLDENKMFMYLEYKGFNEKNIKRVISIIKQESEKNRRT